MENPTSESKTRYLVLNTLPGTKPIITESDVNVAYLGGLLLGGVLVGFTVAGVMADKHRREQRQLRAEVQRLTASSKTIEYTIKDTLERADRLLDKIKMNVEMDVDNVTPFRS